MQPLTAARLSLVAGVLILGLKFLAWRLTGSVALYSDALESVVNVVAAGAAVVALSVARLPADDNHPFGHSKAEYFSAVLEGVLIVLAALAIVHEAWGRLFAPTAIQSLSRGMAVSLLASAMNGALAWYLLRLGRRRKSPALRADGIHLVTDVVTSLGVLLGIGLAWVTGTWVLDPLLALLVAANILWAGSKLVRDSLSELMDLAMPPTELRALEAALTQPRPGMLEVHDLKTRRAGATTFVQFHLVVEGAMAVDDAHRLCDALEEQVCQAYPDAQVVIHVEPESEALGHGFRLGTGS